MSTVFASRSAASTVHPGRWLALISAVFIAAGCGGGSGSTAQDSGPDKTTLSVVANDAEGDTLHYQWRVTAGRIDNRDTPTTTWTLPAGPGLHFAYVTVSDNRGGHAQMQYAVSSDALDTTATLAAQAPHAAPAVTDDGRLGGLLRFQAAGNWSYTGFDSSTSGQRVLYLPDVLAEVRDATGQTLFSGRSDVYGELALPRLPVPASGAYSIFCTRDPALPSSTWPACTSYTPGSTPVAVQVSSAGSANLRLYGHVELNDGSACGRQDPYFSLSNTATLRVLHADGTAATPAIRVNRYGDYLLETAVAALGRYRLEVTCENHRQEFDVPPPPGAGYLAATPVQMPPARLANSAPRITRMVAAGPDGNVRGKMVTALPGSMSDSLPGPDRFLVFKGQDTPQSACAYYRALGMAADCDAQGTMTQPVTMDAWKRQHGLPPYDSGVAATDKASADYINKMDLNLVRRMSASRRSADQIALLVCNHPGPDGQSQAEVDSVIDQALQGQKLVACVGMEWSVTPGANGNRPFTKFVTFGPDGALLASVNLDGRGEKYLPGACVACHGGTAYGGRFPTDSGVSPYLGSAFLPFDAGNYLFGSGADLGEAAQQTSLYRLNQLVRATETPAPGEADTAIMRLISGWYPGGTTAQDKHYVPSVWTGSAGTPTAGVAGASRLYQEVIGASCRTCHAALANGNAAIDWDRQIPSGYRNHLCGGGADLARNRSMPNALVTLDRVIDKLKTDAALLAASQTVFGCDITQPLGDPIFNTR